MRKTVFMKLALVLAGAFLFATVSHAQSFTTVTATVTDSNGIPYAGGSMSATLTPGTPGGWTLNGQPYSGTVGPVTLDSTGTFIANFGSNAVILPAGTQWKITIGSNPGGIPPPLGTGAQTFSATMTISGSTQNISGTLNAAAPKLTNFSGGGGGSGTVTTIATTGPITGGPITTTGTIACPTCVTASGGGSITIAANQVAFGSGTNTVIGSNGLQYLNPGGACALTIAAALTQCDNGGALTPFNGDSSLAEFIAPNANVWNLIASNAGGTGNSGTARGTFLGLGTQTAANNDLEDLTYVYNGVLEAYVQFGGGQAGRPSGISQALYFDGNGAVEFGINNTDMSVTEFKANPNGGLELLTDAGFNTCFFGSTSGNACVGVAAVAGTPNPMHWPTTTGTAGQVLSTNGANPQQLVWITPSGGGSVSNQVLRGISANSSGTPTVVDSVVCTPPTTDGLFTVGYTVVASVAVAPTCPQVGVASASISGATSTYTVGTSVPNDASGIPIVHDIAGSSAVAVTLPTPTTLANTNAVVTYENRSAFTDTITPTTFTIQAGTSTASSSIPVPPGTRVQMIVDKFNANTWLATMVPLETATNGLTLVGALNAGSIPSPGPIGGTTPSSIAATSLSVSGTSTLAAASLSGTLTLNGAAIANEGINAQCVASLTAPVYAMNSTASPSSYNTGIGTFCDSSVRIIAGGSSPMDYTSGGSALTNGDTECYLNASATGDVCFKHDTSNGILDLNLSGTPGAGALKFTALYTPASKVCGFGTGACATSGSPGTLVSSAVNAMYGVHITVNCASAISTATANATVSYTDQSGTAQTISPVAAAACTTLGTASIVTIYTDIAPEATTAITYFETVANAPNATVRIAILQETVN